MNPQDFAEPTEIPGKVLVVEDDQTSRVLHQRLLARKFDVRSAACGQDALAICLDWKPDLVLLDIGLPGLDGYETCRILREDSTIPIIFATAHKSLEVHLKAYESGGDDIITKPVNQSILLRKVENAIRRHQATIVLTEERNSLQKMAMGFLSTMGESGTLLNFMRACVACRTHRELAEKLVAAIRDFGVECSLMIRHAQGSTIMTSHGDATSLERSILEQSSSIGRIFQFKQRLVVNYDRISIIIANMPDEDSNPEQVGRIRDNITILAESAEAMCDSVDMRIESMARTERLQRVLEESGGVVEQLRKKHSAALRDARLLLEELTGGVEKNFSWLETNQNQELTIKHIMEHSVDQILALWVEGGDFDRQFAQLLEALHGGASADGVLQRSRVQ